MSGSKRYYAIEGQLLAMYDGSSTNYLLTDSLGCVVDGSGALVREQRYLPFGEERVLSGTVQTELSFTGQRELTGTGLLDYHARQYDPSLRTLIQPDPIIPNPYGVQDYNRYLYVHANPLRSTDPSGNRITDGCRTDGCSISQYQKDLDTQKLALLEHEVMQQKCKESNLNYCAPNYFLTCPQSLIHILC